MTLTLTINQHSMANSTDKKGEANSSKKEREKVKTSLSSMASSTLMTLTLTINQHSMANSTDQRREANSSKKEREKVKTSLSSMVNSVETANQNAQNSTVNSISTLMTTNSAENS